MGTRANTLTVNAGPTVTALNVAAMGQGAVARDVMITGTGFVSGASAVFSGTGISVLSTSFVSSTSVMARISIANSATLGLRDVTMVNPDLGRATLVGKFSVAAGPTVTSLTPARRAQGTATVTVTVTGTNFATGSVVAIPATGVTVGATTFVSSTTLTVPVTVAATAPVGPLTVRVTNTNFGRIDAAGAFTVTAQPTVTAASPLVMGQGATARNVTITGTNFGAGAVASFSGTGITVTSTSVVSSTQLTATITIAAAATTGLRNITVTNSDGGVASGANLFTVVAGPTVTAVSPNQLGLTATDRVLTVTGSNFVDGSVVTFSGTGITVLSTTFVSATQLSITVSVASTATTGLRSVTVVRPDLGQSTLANAFTVAPLPTITSITPTSRGQGAANQNITVTGTNFRSGATASFSGTGITVNSVTVSSATTAVVNITVAATATLGLRDLTITNSIGGSVTRAGIFTVAAAPTITSITPASRGQGAVSQSLTFVGTGFAAGAAVSFSGTGITVNSVTVVSATQLTVNISIAATATTGLRDVNVANTTNAGRSTKVGAFTVGAAPTFTSLSRTSQTRNTTVTVTVNGSGFLAGATLLFSGTGITVNSVTFVSATQFTVSLTVASTATTGARTVTIVNGNGGRVAAGSYTVL